MIQVNIQGHGTFYISNENIQSLLDWLKNNNGVKTQNSNVNETKTVFNGNELLIE